MDQALGALVEKYQWTECYLFGSILLTGRFGPDSDVDIAVGGLAKHDLYRLISSPSPEEDALEHSGSATAPVVLR